MSDEQHIEIGSGDDVDVSLAAGTTQPTGTSAVGNAKKPPKYKWGNQECSVDPPITRFKLPAVDKLTAADRALVKTLVGQVAGSGTEEGVKAAHTEWQKLITKGIPIEVAEETLPAAMERIEKRDSEGKIVSVELPDLELRVKFWSQWMVGEYPRLAAVGSRVLLMHATTAAAERNWSLWGNVFTRARNRLGLEEKLIFTRGNEQGGMERGRYGMLADEEVVMELLSEE